MATKYFIQLEGNCYEILQDKAYLIGRSPDADFQVRNRFVSRRHASLVWVEKSWRLTDGDCLITGTLSTGGIFVENRQVCYLDLSNGCEVWLGSPCAKIGSKLRYIEDCDSEEIPESQKETQSMQFP